MTPPPPTGDGDGDGDGDDAVKPKTSATDDGGTPAAEGSSPSPSPSPAPLPMVMVDADALPVSTGSDAELREAVGAKPAPKRAPSDHDDDHPDAPAHKRSRAAFVAGFALIGALLVGALVLLGHLNADRYEIVCAPDEIRAETGRAFPPWGLRERTGPEWKAITIPPDAECTAADAQTETGLTTMFLGLLVERADKALLARDPTQAEVAAVQLQQALLLTRSDARRDERKTIERMLGDVEYWRATGKLAAARALLLDAAKQFEAANTAVPRHVKDAFGRATYARQVADDLQSGSDSSHAGSSAAVAEHPGAPLGVALPVEPRAPAPGVGSNLAMPLSDAGVPPSGVLL